MGFKEIKAKLLETNEGLLKVLIVPVVVVVVTIWYQYQSARLTTNAEIAKFSQQTLVDSGLNWSARSWAARRLISSQDEPLRDTEVLEFYAGQYIRTLRGLTFVSVATIADDNWQIKCLNDSIEVRLTLSLDTQAWNIEFSDSLKSIIFSSLEGITVSLNIKPFPFLVSYSLFKTRMRMDIPTLNRGRYEFKAHFSRLELYKLIKDNNLQDFMYFELSFAGLDRCTLNAEIQLIALGKQKITGLFKVHKRKPEQVNLALLFVKLF